MLRLTTRGLFFQSKVDIRKRNRRKPTWGELREGVSKVESSHISLGFLNNLESLDPLAWIGGIP